MMMVGIVDVFARYVFNRPMTGTFEIFEILLPAAVLFGLAYTQRVKGHVRVEVFHTLYPPRLQAIIDSFITGWAILLFALIAWRGTMLAIMHRQTGRLLSNIEVPIWLVELFIPIGTLSICLVLLVDFFDHLRRITKE
jgi:TRAP-type C4-dicarboxylate transport system permease small subunit